MSSEKCLGKVQADFDNAYKWTQEWFQKLNIDKCLVMHYGLSNNKYLLHINGKQLVKSDLKEIQASSVLKCDIDMIEQIQQQAKKLIASPQLET